MRNSSKICEINVKNNIILKTSNTKMDYIIKKKKFKKNIHNKYRCIKLLNSLINVIIKNKNIKNTSMFIVQFQNFTNKITKGNIKLNCINQHPKWSKITKCFVKRHTLNYLKYFDVIPCLRQVSCNKSYAINTFITKSIKIASKIRKSQKPPKGKWRIWMLMAGRGFGKTYAGSNAILQWILEKKYKHICFISKTFDDVEKVMIKGPSGILHLLHENEIKFKYHKTQKTIEIEDTGIKIYLYSSDASEALRGPQFDCVWIDEFAKFDDGEYVLSQLEFCLRMSEDAKILITTTPKPTKIIKSIIQRNDIVVVRGSTYENAKNLPKSFIKSITNTYKNTQLGRQEIYGDIIDNDEPIKPEMIMYASINYSNNRYFCSDDNKTSAVKNNNHEKNMVDKNLNFDSENDDKSSDFDKKNDDFSAKKNNNHGKESHVKNTNNNGKEFYIKNANYNNWKIYKSFKGNFDKNTYNDNQPHIKNANDNGKEFHIKSENYNDWKIYKSFKGNFDKNTYNDNRKFDFNKMKNTDLPFKNMIRAQCKAYNIMKKLCISNNTTFNYYKNHHIKYELSHNLHLNNIITKNINSQKMHETESNEIVKIVIGVDPAVTSHEGSDETGIIVVGVDGKGEKYYVLDDLSGKHNPNAWCKIIIAAYQKYSANKIVAEVNNGGDIVESMLKMYNSTIPFKSVYATKGKLVRAEPIIALYEQGRVFHTKKSFYELEEQILNLKSKQKSPDRFDALVWGITELMTMPLDENNSQNDEGKLKVWFI